LAQPEWAGTCDKPYFGTSWYKLEFRIPSTYKGKKLHLNFGGVMTDCKVWLNGILLGEHHYANVPFGFVIDGIAKTGQKNVLTVMVENNQTYMDKTPENTHGFGTTVMEMRWSGIFRDVEIVATEEIHISDLYIVPDINKGQISCNYEISGKLSKKMEIHARVFQLGKQQVVGQTSKELDDKNDGNLTVKIENPKLWYDYDPNLYVLSLSIQKKNTVIDEINERFGLREVSTDGEYIYLNGKPVYFRGEMCHIHWPQTISPPTDRNDIKEKLTLFKDYGFNFFRHHTHFPGVEFLDVCDEIGILNWNEINVVESSMIISEEHQDALWTNLVKRDKNHPSVIIWCMGNERNASESKIEHFKELTFGIDKTRFLLTNSPGWLINSKGQSFRLPIHHEYRRAGASYIDFGYKNNFKDSKLRPWRVLYTQEKTKQAGIDSLLPVFTKHTQLLQAKSRKILLEQARLNKDEISDTYNLKGLNYVGYQLATFKDAGSFMWGVVDDYYNPKIVPPKELRNYNNATVLLWNQHWTERCFYAGTEKEKTHSISGDRSRVIPIIIKCSHFGEHAIENGILKWKIVDEQNKVYKSGMMDDVQIGLGELNIICSDYFFLPETDIPLTINLKATLETNGLSLENSWDFWVFPRVIQSSRGFDPDIAALKKSNIQVIANLENQNFLRRIRNTYPFIKTFNGIPQNESLLITDIFDDTVLEFLQKGHRVLLYGNEHFDGHITEWGAGRSEFARGTKIYQHPLMDKFPHQGWCDIPFSNMISGTEDLHGNRNRNGVIMDLRPWPDNVFPIILGFPSYKDENPQLYSFMLEAKVKDGKFLTTTFDLWKTDPASVYFFDQLLRYLCGNDFNPDSQINLDFLEEQMGKKAQIREHIIEFRKDGVMPNLERPDEPPYKHE
jgi:hypothetical protein